MKSHFLDIEELKDININGVKQSILIRGCKLDNPILLYIHGGPGVSNMFLYPYEKKIEEKFIVVKWDQRGTAKSYDRKISKDTFNIEQFISDTYEVCKYIYKRFNKKIYLIGHSWGSLLGINIVYRYPELFLGYIGIGQLVNDFESEKLAYRYILKIAKLKKYKLDIKTLNKLMQLNYRNNYTASKIEKLIKKYRGDFYNKKTKLLVIRLILKCKYYSIRDLFKFLKGLNINKDLINSMININLFEEIKELKIPIYICRKI